MISLTNGCVCCTINDDLVETVMKTINVPERPNYIMIEVSGVALSYYKQHVIDLSSAQEYIGSEEETLTEDITYLTNIRSKKLIGILARL